MPPTKVFFLLAAVVCIPAELLGLDRLVTVGIYVALGILACFVWASDSPGGTLAVIVVIGMLLGVSAAIWLWANAGMNDHASYQSDTEGDWIAPTIVVVVFWVVVGKLLGSLLGLSGSSAAVPRKRVRLTQELRSTVLRRDGYRCVHCGDDWCLEVDHVRPWSLGGADDVSNLQTLCRRCNRSKRNRFTG